MAKIIKLDNVAEWERFDISKTLVLHGEKRRRIRVEFNASDPIRVSLLKGTLRDEMVFLANIDEPTVLDFIEIGNVHIVVNPLFDKIEPEVYYYTADGEATSHPMEDRTIFTRMHTRTARNPELEMLQLKMMQNMDRRMEQMQRDTALQTRELQRQLEARSNEPTPEPSRTPADPSGSDVPEPDAGSGAETGGTTPDGAEPAKPAGKAKS